MGKHVWGPLTPEGLAATGQVPVEEPKPAEPAKPTRKRKSRWADESDKAAADGAAGKEIVLFPEKVVLSNGMQVIIPPAISGRGDPDVLRLHKELNELSRNIQSGQVDIPPEGERSPSPPPVYDVMGMRLNTREVRYKEKMVRQRNHLIEALLAKDPSYKPPTDYRPEKKWKKIFIPTKKYPGYNFIGLIIGPRGNTQKRMQSETNTKIAIRGRGSVKEGASRDPKYDYGEDEELHVLITGDRQEDVDAAAAMIERLLMPEDDEMNEHKKLQLRELASLNGTLKDEQFCFICGESGHQQSDCPKTAVDVYRLPDKLQSAVDDMYAKDVARMNPGEAVKMDTEYRSFLAELGGGPQPELGGGGGGPPQRGRESDACKLYVGNLSPAVNDALLRQMFEPFGTVTFAGIMMDSATNTSRGFGFVHMSDEQTALTAKEGMNGKMVDGRPLNVRVRSEPPSGPGARRGPGGPRPEDDLPPECKLYVGCLPQHVEEQALSQEFARFGPVVSARVITDRETGRPRGFGFVNMGDPGSARNAIAGMDGFNRWGGAIVVRLAGTGDTGRGQRPFAPPGGGFPPPGGGFPPPGPPHGPMGGFSGPPQPYGPPFGGPPGGFPPPYGPPFGGPPGGFPPGPHGPPFGGPPFGGPPGGFPHGPPPPYGGGFGGPQAYPPPPGMGGQWGGGQLPPPPPPETWGNQPPPPPDDGAGLPPPPPPDTWGNQPPPPPESWNGPPLPPGA